MPVQSFKVGEMLNKRTPNSKTWINFDGSYTTEIHQGIIHYEDASGNLHNINTDLFDEADFNEIDFPVAKDGDSLFYEQQAKATKDKKKNRLNRENYDFQGLAVPYECRIPRNIRRGYSIGKGASKLKFIPVGASVSKGYAEGNKITYPDVWNDADLVLELLPEGIKETIILKTDKAPINFSFEVQGELVEELKIQPMWLMDAEGTKRDVLQGVSEVDDKVLLNIAADTSNLIYPIEVDPTVTIQPPDATAGYDTCVRSDTPTTYYWSDQAMYSGFSGGYEFQSLVKFVMPSLPAGVLISEAKLDLRIGGGNHTLNFPCGLYENTSAFSQYTTWNTRPTARAISENTVMVNSQTGFCTFLLTDLVSRWISGTSANNGLVLKSTDSSLQRFVNFYTSEDSNPTNRPKLTISYNAPPTAPIVTAPNGGETWNSSHTVAWNAATDPAQDETNFYTTTSFDDMGGNGSNVAQTFTMQKSGLLTKVRPYCKVTSSGLGALSWQIRNVNPDGTPGSTVLYSFTMGALVSFSQMEHVLSTPLNVTAGQKLALVMVSNVSPYYFHFGGRISGGDGYTGGGYYLNGVHQTNKDAQIQIFYKEISDLQYQIQLSTNNGNTWKDIVALTSAGATSYPYDFINEAETSTALIRVRAYDGSAYGPWDTSNGVFTIVHNQAPTAPTGLSPSGEPKDRASVVRFGWLHNDPNAGDPQSKFDLQWRVQGSPTWNTVTQATTNNYYDMPAGTLPKGTIEWQVRTYDQAGLPSPYSALQVFIAGDKPPTPTITGPVNGSVVPVSKPVVQWSSVDQAAYQVNVLNDSGSTTLWTTGQVNSGNKAVTVGIDLENNTDYKIQTLVRGAEGIWSTAAISNITVSYAPPALPILTTSTDSEKGTITVQIDNPLPIGTEPTVLYNDLFRLEPGGLWERIATNIPSDGFYTDYTVASGKNYQYKVVVLGDNETVRESGIISNSVSFKGIYLQVASDPLNTSYQFKNDSEGRSSKWNLNHTYHKFAGRNNLVIDTEDSSDYGVDFSLKLKTTEELTALERIIYSQEVVCYRDGRGRKVFGVFTGFPLEDATWGESTSLNLMKIDYKEEVL